MADMEVEEGDSISTTATNTSTAPKPKKKAGRPKKAASGAKAKKTRAKKNEAPPPTDIVEPEDDDFEVKIETKPAKSRNAKKRKSDEMEIDEAKEVENEPEEVAERDSTPPPKKRATKTRAKATGEAPKARKKAAGAAKPVEEAKPVQERPATPTPPVSPQTSDAENQPPSVLSRSSVLQSTQKTRTPLPASTPVGPKRHHNAFEEDGPQIQLTWETADLEAVFLKSPTSHHVEDQDKENVGTQLLNDAISGVQGKLTSPEKKMTVEEWINFNAVLGEKRLRGECERLVGVFEREGNRALQALEMIPIVERR